MDELVQRHSSLFLQWGAMHCRENPKFALNSLLIEIRELDALIATLDSSNIYLFSFVTWRPGFSKEITFNHDIAKQSEEEII